MHRMTGAEITIRLLERQGIRRIAGIPGGANLPLYDALSRSESICHVLARHEQGAGFMAQGAARTSGRPAVCFATSGPGATNILTALADAKLDSVPIVCITGQVPSTMIGTDAFQEVDTYGMSIPVTKHNFLVWSAEDLFRVIPEAFSIAASGRPGPVLIDIPRDVQTSVLEVAEWPEPGGPDPAPTFYDAEIGRAVEMINASRRPVLWVGGGVVAGGAQDLAVELAERAGIPVTMTLMGLPAFPRDHPNAIGMLGMHAERYTNMAMEGCDLIIAAGVRFDDRATGKVQEFCPDAKVIHVDIDHSEIDKIRAASVGILGDIRDVLTEILAGVEENPREEWLGYIHAMRQAFPPLAPANGGLESPQRLVRMVGEIIPDDSIIVTDVGKHQMWAAQSFPFSGGQKWLTSGGLGTMGFGLPAAIGAALAGEGRRTVCFSGDGSLLMNIQEFATAAEQGADVTVILFDNCCLGLVHQQQELFFDENYFSSIFHTQVDFLKIAEGFGWRALSLAEVSSPEAALVEALKERGPCLIHVPVSRDEKVLPMVPPGAANRVMIGGECHA